MKTITTPQIIIAIILLMVIILLAVVYSNYRNDLEQAETRLESIETRVIETDCGEIEFTRYGKGYPVMVIHGIFGGHDQGLVLARGQIGEQFQSIIPSRFGYLGSPLPENVTPADQADALACLLEELDIERTAVLATSAGGTSAIQFALRYPELCSALILVSSNAPGEVDVGLPPKPIARVLFRSDFIFWVLTEYFPSTMHSIMGVPGVFQMTPDYEKELQEVMDTLLPVRPRAAGSLYDMYISNPAINSYPVAEITVPTLILHAEDDPLANYQNVKIMAKKIPEAELVSFESGGHPLLGREKRISREIAVFIAEHQ